MMTRQIDLAALDRVASEGDPLDNVVVSRRWLAQVALEMQAQRRQVPELDYSRYLKDEPDVSIHVRSIETDSLYAGRIDRVSATVGPLGA